MENIIEEIYQIIKDYRSEDGIQMSVEKISSWINQFDSDDREFLLSELVLVLQKRYISKDRAEEVVEGMIEFLALKRSYDSPKDFLLDSSFIDHQPQGKSQKTLLNFLDNIIQRKYDISISDCSPKTPKHYIYLDDILCTGDTIFKGLANGKGNSEKGWFFQVREDGKTNLEYFEDTQAEMIWAYISIHTHNLDKVIGRFWHTFGKRDLNMSQNWDKLYEIDNGFTKSSSKLEFIYPLDNGDDVVTECKDQILDKIIKYQAQFGNNPEAHFYRSNGKPQDESLFSSHENRNRFEEIILKKSIEIYNSSPKMQSNPRAKPLGYGTNSDCSFGFGTMIFTWRNVPFNVPLVFWYSHNNWIPLFDRKFITYEDNIFTLLWR